MNSHWKTHYIKYECKYIEYILFFLTVKYVYITYKNIFPNTHIKLNTHINTAIKINVYNADHQRSILCITNHADPNNTVKEIGRNVGNNIYSYNVTWNTLWEPRIRLLNGTPSWNPKGGQMETLWYHRRWSIKTQFETPDSCKMEHLLRSQKTVK